RRIDRVALSWRHQPAVRACGSDPVRSRSEVSADRAKAARPSRGRRKATAWPQNGQRRNRRRGHRGSDNAAAAPRDRRGAQGHHRYARAASPRATGTESRDIRTARLADGRKHRSGPCCIGDPGDHHGADPTRPARSRAFRRLTEALPMSQTRLLALVLAAVLAVAGGWFFGTATQPVQRSSLGNGQLMFPDLTAKLKDAR